MSMQQFSFWTTWKAQRDVMYLCPSAHWRIWRGLWWGRDSSCCKWSVFRAARSHRDQMSTSSQRRAWRPVCAAFTECAEFRNFYCWQSASCQNIHVMFVVKHCQPINRWKDNRVPSAWNLGHNIPHQLKNLPRVDFMICGVVSKLSVSPCTKGEHTSFLFKQRERRKSSKASSAKCASRPRSLQGGIYWVVDLVDMLLFFSEAMLLQRPILINLWQMYSAYSISPCLTAK